MGRAIVREPSVFLMDEPLSNLDAKMRVQMRAEISRIQRRVGVATFYVTHDQTEAMTMGDRVAVLHMGELQQCDTPQYLYEHPDNLFVAAFIGSPAMNLYEAIVSPEADSVKVGSQSLSLPGGHPGRPRRRCGATGTARSSSASAPRTSTTRPCGDAAPVPGNTLIADVELVEALGNELQVHFLIDATKARSETTAGRPGDRGAGRPDQLARPASPGPKGWPASRPAPTSGPAPGSPWGAHRTADSTVVPPDDEVISRSVSLASEWPNERGRSAGRLCGASSAGCVVSWPVRQAPVWFSHWRTGYCAQWTRRLPPLSFALLLPVRWTACR